MDIFKEKKFFIFDFDGTLADSMDYWELYSKADPKPDIETFYEYMKGIYRESVKPVPGSLEFLAYCRSCGKKCYIATATKLSVCVSCIERLGYGNLVEKCFCCNDFGVSKLGGFYDKVAEAIGCTKRDTVIFEDCTPWARVAYEDGFDIVGVYDRHNTTFNELAGFAVAKIESYTAELERLKVISQKQGKYSDMTESY